MSKESKKKENGMIKEKTECKHTGEEKCNKCECKETDNKQTKKLYEVVGYNKYTDIKNIIQADSEDKAVIKVLDKLKKGGIVKEFTKKTLKEYNKEGLDYSNNIDFKVTKILDKDNKSKYYYITKRE